MVSAGKMIKHGLAAMFPGLVLIRQKNAKHDMALTFDDGPHPQHTPRILDILDAGKATATFFIQGKIAHEYPALVREIHARGHQIGNHGYSHLDAHQARLSVYVEETKQAQDVLQDILGQRIEKIFRPPYGNITGPSFLALAWQGFRFVFWSQDSRDSFIRMPSALIEHVDSLRVVGGDILLLHEDYPHTVESLPRIVQSLKDRSLMFSRISDLGRRHEI